MPLAVYTRYNCTPTAFGDAGWYTAVCAIIRDDQQRPKWRTGGQFSVRDLGKSQHLIGLFTKELIGQLLC